MNPHAHQCCEIGLGKAYGSAIDAHPMWERATCLQKAPCRNINSSAQPSMHHYKGTICQVVYAIPEVLSAETQLAGYSHSTKQLTHMQTGKIHFAAGKCGQLYCSVSVTISSIVSIDTMGAKCLCRLLQQVWRMSCFNRDVNIWTHLSCTDH